MPLLMELISHLAWFSTNIPLLTELVRCICILIPLKTARERPAVCDPFSTVGIPGRPQPRHHCGNVGSLGCYNSRLAREQPVKSLKTNRYVYKQGAVSFRARRSAGKPSVASTRSPLLTSLFQSKVA